MVVRYAIFFLVASLVMGSAHVVVARYDLLAQDALGSCIFVDEGSDAGCDTADASPTPV